MFPNRISIIFLVPFMAFTAIGILYKYILSTSSNIIHDEVVGLQYVIAEEKINQETLRETPINFCLQHANKCPLDQSIWQGEVDAWNYTGKKWIWHPETPSERNVIWIWNRPYIGSTAAYDGQREAHYSDFTSNPDSSPDFTGNAPFTYDWERWEPVEDNQKLHQYGKATESESWIIGESICETGVYYPVIDHQRTIDYTPMSVVRGGECIAGGYIYTYRKELWGSPLSQTRVNNCDNSTYGVPANYSLPANIICKYSPYVGVVEQRYAWQAGPPPEDAPLIGCEVAVYAWGWQEPPHVVTGQDYQAWFRNGELRFSRWKNLSDQISDQVPAPDDHTWWNQGCETAWAGTTNNLYSGIFKIGSTVYTDTIVSPPQVSIVIPIEGGVLTSTSGNVFITFPPQTFTESVTVTYTTRSQDDFIGYDGMLDTTPLYELSVVSRESGMKVDPIHPYSVTIQGGGTGENGIQGDLLALQYWNGEQWVNEITSKVMTESNTLTASPSHFSLWGIQVESHHVFLPFMQLSIHY